MITIKTMAVQSDNLKPYIKNYWLLTGKYCGVHQTQLLPTCSMDLIINLANPIFYNGLGAPDVHFNALRQGPVLLAQQDDICTLGITFHPYGAFPFLSSPTLIECIKNTATHFHHVAHDALAVIDLIQCCEDVLLDHLNTRFLPPIELTHLMQALHETNTTMVPAFSELSKTVYLTERTLERHFNRYIGTSPKKYARLVQFRRTLHDLWALHALEDRGLQTACFTDIAVKQGYFDQSHFIKSFKQYTGVTPGQFHQLNCLKPKD